MSRLENKVVLISGGASGIGAATARLVVREGGKAVLADRDEAKGRALAGELGDAALFVPLDVTDEAAWNKAVAATVETFGGLHGLLNAAGVGVRNSIEDCTLADYRRVNDINSAGHLPRLQGRDPGDEAGRAAARSSTSPRCSACAAPPTRWPTAPARARCGSLTKHVALHCAQMKYNIRCNSVHPGYIDTPMIAPRLDQPIGNMSGRQWLEELHPLGRLGRARGGRRHDPVPAVGRELTFSTGSEFVCDGGLTA